MIVQIASVYAALHTTRSFQSVRFSTFGVRPSTTLLLTGSPLAENRCSERADISEKPASSTGAARRPAKSCHGDRHENSAYDAISFLNYLRCYSVLRARPESWRVLLEVCRVVGIEESRFHRRWKYSE